ncbi:helix-turn-helix domain-containing protein [Kitasatospora sp. NPDC094011]|uniref:helix-turn-helix domain-containing protein n=1 Tax=Kitasatospora sp. NPDC094011 TaxID=3364090 RepID=UPI00382B4DFB
MPGRSNPTLRQRRLGAELRRLREQAGLGGTQLARTLGVSPAHVTQMETGKTSVTLDRLHAIAETCMCANQALIAALADIIAIREKAGWWEEYRESLTTDFLEIAELEAGAHRLTTYTSTFMPGMLQTGDYARVLFEQTYPPLPPHQIDLRTTFRMQRQRIVRSGETPYAAFIHETALHMQFCGPTILAGQLEALIADSEHPSIAVRVVPFGASVVPSPSENFTYATGPITELDAAQMDTGHGGQLFETPAHLARFRALITQMESSALSEGDSRDLIRSLKDELESKHG